MALRIGLPMWALPEWQHGFFTQDAGSADFLKQYASVFTTVEGNTTFYSIPTEASVIAWRKSVPAVFRFCFKMPKSITHDAKLQRCDALLSAFIERMKPLKDVMGPLMIQLPPSFDGRSLPHLESFIKKLPIIFNYAVEPRHSDFFDGGAYQQGFQALLAKYRIEQVVFDSRALFACDDTHTSIVEAKAKKPNFPLPEVTVHKQVIIRFVGGSDADENAAYFAEYVDKIRHWLAAGKQVYLLLHMANNHYAPALAKQLYAQLQVAMPELADLPLWPVERESNDGQMLLF